MPKTYQHLDVYSDLVVSVKRSHQLFPQPKPGRARKKVLLDALAFDPAPAKPRQVKIGRTWEKDGVIGEEVSWSVGYGPRVEAWLLRPAGVKEKLPGVLALHDHGGFKYLGKEKVAEGPEPLHETVPSRNDRIYGGRCFANALAREGFAVLAHDCFLFGSRKFPYEKIPERFRLLGERLVNLDAAPGKPPFWSTYNSVAGHHETYVGHYCKLMGTSIGAVACYEDRVAAAYLASRKDVQPGGVGCVGLSGGGFRSGTLSGACDDIRVTVVVAAMCTFEGLLDHNIVNHGTDWLPVNWGRFGDWPDIPGSRAPSPLMVQFDQDDALFSLEGMRGADRRLKAIYRAAGKPGNYAGRFYPGPHKFDLDMQRDAFAWLGEHLSH